MEETEIVRFGVSMNRDLVEQFDQMIAGQGYGNRSEAIRDLVRKALIDPKRLQLEKSVAGTIVIVYHHHLSDSLTDLQHHYHHEIVSTMHIHLNYHQCLEIIVVRGKLKRLKELHQRIQVLKNVVYAELSVTNIDDEGEEHAHSHD